MVRIKCLNIDYQHDQKVSDGAYSGMHKFSCQIHVYHLILCVLSYWLDQKFYQNYRTTTCVKRRYVYETYARTTLIMISYVAKCKSSNVPFALVPVTYGFDTLKKIRMLNIKRTNIKPSIKRVTDLMRYLSSAAFLDFRLD